MGQGRKSDLSHILSVVILAFISINWRGKPLTSYQVIITLITATTTRTGLKVNARLDKKKYSKAKKISDREMKELAIVKNKFHGEWNYTVKPRKTRPQDAQVIL